MTTAKATTAGRPATDGAKPVSYREALTQAMREEMERDPDVFIIGEDVGPVRGRVQGHARPARASSASGAWWTRPISEAGFVGIGIGAAMAGLRP